MINLTYKAADAQAAGKYIEEQKEANLSIKRATNLRQTLILKVKYHKE